MKHSHMHEGAAAERQPDPAAAMVENFEQEVRQSKEDFDRGKIEELTREVNRLNAAYDAWQLERKELQDGIATAIQQLQKLQHI